MAPLLEYPPDMRTSHLIAIALALIPYLPAQIESRAVQNPLSKPSLIQWQRTLRDALHLAKTKKLPLLIVANQDNEQACDSLANVRYRDARFAKLAGRYVAVIGSVFRHNARDFDDQGRRIPCPRFGCVTCGEHIAMEPKIYEKYFQDNRTAPRHIGIGVGGKRLFDNFLDRSLSAIDDSLRKNAKQTNPMPDLKSKDRSLAGLLDGRTNADRLEVEAKFAKADARGRVAILETAKKSGYDHPDLVRISLMDANAAVRAAGASLLVKTANEDSLDLTLQFLGTARSQSEYDTLLTALERPAKTNDTFRRALTIRNALRAESKRVDPAKWSEHYQNSGGERLPENVPNEELADLDKSIETNTKNARKDDPGGKLWMEVARANFRYALNRMQNQKDPTFLLHDAESAVGHAVEKGMAKEKAAILRTRILWLLSKQKEAGEQAELALTGDSLAEEAASANALTALEVYARTQREPLNNPVENEKDYPAQSVTEVHRAYQALVAHPLATAQHARDQIDFLLYLGARREAGVANRAAVKRFSSDSNLHAYLINQAKWEGGMTALAATYETLQNQRRDPSTDYYAGYAMLLVAEEHVRTKSLPAAERAYQKSISNFERSWAANEAFRDVASHYAALARGGLAKMALDAGQFDKAYVAILAAATGRPATFESPDGLGNTLQRTARRLRRKLSAEKKTALDEKLKALELSLESK